MGFQYLVCHPGRRAFGLVNLTRSCLPGLRISKRAGRQQLSVVPRLLQEFFTREELSEMSKPEYWEELDKIRKG
jgi:hypothetical protein